MAVRTRIAPSPTGLPHVGTAYQSLFSYVWAKKHAGQFVLRLEDTDRSRLVEGADKNIYEMLRWLGLPFDEGPDIGGPHAPYIQSDRLHKYSEHAQKLVEQGDAYYCFCTSERLAEMRLKQQQQHLPPKYDRLCLSLSSEQVAEEINKGTPHVIRMKVPEGQTTFTDRIRGKITFDNGEIDDQILLKSDGFPTYHLAVVVDDYEMNISDVIRGEEWISSTPKHILLYQFFGWELPTFTHLPLLLNSDKSKLSKRKNDVSLLSYKEQGFLPEALLNFLSQLAWSHPESKDIYSMNEFMDLFNWDRVQKTGAVFGMDKMRWFNGQYIRMMDVSQLAELLQDYSRHSLTEIKRVLPLVHDRLVILSEYDELVEYLYDEPEYEASLLVGKKQTVESTREALAKVLGVLLRMEAWDQEPWEQGLRAAAEELGWKAGELFMALRVAITFSTQSPPLRESMELLGRDVSLRRIEAAIKKLD